MGYFPSTDVCTRILGSRLYRCLYSVLPFWLYSSPFFAAGATFSEGQRDVFSEALYCSINGLFRVGEISNFYTPNNVRNAFALLVSSRPARFHAESLFPSDFKPFLDGSSVL